MNDPFVRVIQHYGFNETVLQPFSIILTTIMGVSVLFLPRRYAIVPLVVVSCLLTQLQRIIVFGLDFNTLRILVIFGLVRILLRHEHVDVKLNQVDRFLIFFVLANVSLYSIRHGTASALINRLGVSFDIFGMYFIPRTLFRDVDDIKIAIKSIFILSIPIAIAMLNEHMTGRNFFSFMGGVPEYSIVRDGNIRSQAVFSHPILAGTFGAVSFGLYYGYWRVSDKKPYMLIFPAFTFLTIIYTCASSGPILTLMAVILALGLWSWRHLIPKIRYAVVGILVLLHLMMKDPVWALIYRVNIISGSTGYHRYALIDRAIRNFKEWALLGTDNMAYWGWGLQDVTNQYVRVGVDGGALTLFFFVLMIWFAFRKIGQVTREGNFSFKHQYMAWALGAALFGHVVSFMSVSYFGQIILYFYMLLAAISSYPLPNPPFHPGHQKGESLADQT